MLSKHCVSLVGSHVEQTFGLAKATRDIVTGLVHIAVVYFREFGVIADQQQGGSDTNDRPYRNAIH